MPLPAGVVKPFAAAWRARAYFLIAFAFWVLYSTIPPPFAGVAQADKQWWQDLIAKAVGSFDKISYLVALAGLIYAVISDVLDYIWTNSLQSEIRKGFSETGSILTGSLSSFTSGLVGMTFESCKVWVEGGRGNPNQIRSIAQSALVGYYGKHNLEKDNFVTFLMEEMLDNWGFSASQTWENFHSNVTIRQSSLAGHFEWEENRTYTLVCISRTGELPLRLEGSAQVLAAGVADALDLMEFKVRVGGQSLVDFKSWWLNHRQKLKPGPFKEENDGFVIEYDGVWLRYEFKFECAISAERTDVAIFEKSYISSEDRCYALALRHPTWGVHSTVTVEGLPNWIVKPPVASAELYEKGGRAVRIEKNHKHSASASMPGWTLPGVAVVIEWSPG